MSKKDKRWFCLDCSVHTGKIGEHYFIQTPLWMAAVGSNKGMLCIKCLEKRIGRMLNKKDFTICHINNPKLYSMSDRLKNRLLSQE